MNTKSISDLYDIVKYCALSNIGTYSAYELQAQANQHAFCSPEIVQQVLNNLLISNFIYIVDSIPAPMYVTTQPQLWTEECANFFAKLNGEISEEVPSGFTNAPVSVAVPDPKIPNPEVEPNVEVDKTIPVKPTNSTLTVAPTTPITRDKRADAGDISTVLPETKQGETIQSIKQQPIIPPVINKLKRRYYEQHPEELKGGKF